MGDSPIAGAGLFADNNLGNLAQYRINSYVPNKRGGPNNGGNLPKSINEETLLKGEGEIFITFEH